MAKLTGNNLDLVFEYRKINPYGVVIYCFRIKRGGMSFINLAIINKRFYDKGFVFDLDEEKDELINGDKDALIKFFIKIFQERKGGIIADYEDDFRLKAITWNENKIETGKRWKGRTIATREDENSELKVESYSNVMNKLFVPFLEDQLELIIRVDNHYFKESYYNSDVIIRMKTTFYYLGLFIEEMINENKMFFGTSKGK